LLQQQGAQFPPGLHESGVALHQVPQFAASFFRSTQPTPGQRVSVALAHAHLPATHALPPVQAPQENEPPQPSLRSPQAATAADAAHLPATQLFEAQSPFTAHLLLGPQLGEQASGAGVSAGGLRGGHEKLARLCVDDVSTCVGGVRNRRRWRRG